MNPRSLILLILALAAFLAPGCAKKPAPAVDYSRTNQLAIVLGEVNREYGLKQTKHYQDGTTTPDRAQGLECRLAKPAAPKHAYFYFVIDPSFKTTNCMDATVTVEYYDLAPGTLELQYDSKKAGPFTRCNKKVTLKASRLWEEAAFNLKAARFDNSQPDSADFRIKSTAPEIFVRRVTLKRNDDPANTAN